MTAKSTETKLKNVRFNVGGHYHEVSISLIEQYEDTMLARLVSDTWLADPDAIIFMDRDGDTFKYVLYYMRYGKVSLPITVSREMFLLDMEYYGFRSADKDTARSTLTPSQIDDSDASKEVLVRCATVFQTAYLSVQAMNKTKRELETEICCLEKAMEYARLYMDRTTIGVTTLYVNHYVQGAAGSEERTKSTQFHNYLHGSISNNHELFNRCLAKFGLNATEISYNYPCIGLTIATCGCPRTGN